MANLRKIALRGAVIFFALLIVGVIVGRIAFNAYLNSPEFRTKIGDAAAHTLKARGEFMPFQLSGTTAYTDGFTAQGYPESFFSALRADQIRAEFNWHGLLRKAWQIDRLDLERLDLTFANQRPEPHAPRSEEPAITKPQEAGWTVDLRQASVRDSHWRWEGGELAGAALTLTPSDGSWLVDVNGGTLRQSNWPALTLESARVRYQPSMLYITNATLRSADGRAEVTGEVDLQRAADLQVAFSDFDIAPLLTPDWRAKFGGRLTTDAKVHVSLGGATTGGIQASGTAQLQNAQLTALPVLDQIALFTQTQRFRRISFTRLSFDYTQDPAGFVARNFVAESEGLLRVEGDFKVAAGQVDGHFQVGVTATSLQWLPGSRERVFTTARGGYLWAPMQLTGPIDKPNEDLTARLANAAAGEVVQRAQDTVKEGAKAATGVVKGVLDQLLGK